MKGHTWLNAPLMLLAIFAFLPLFGNDLQIKLIIQPFIPGLHSPTGVIPISVHMRRALELCLWQGMHCYTLGGAHFSQMMEITRRGEE